MKHVQENAALIVNFKEYKKIIVPQIKRYGN